MIVDTSALLAILLQEPEASDFRALIVSAENARMSGGSLIEYQAVLTRRLKGEFNDQGVHLLSLLGLTIVPVTEEQARLGQDAYRRYGIGTKHPANLNFGDCFAYALAKATGEPLLFKGDDFIHTDVRRVAD